MIILFFKNLSSYKSIIQSIFFTSPDMQSVSMIHLNSRLQKHFAQFHGIK